MRVGATLRADRAILERLADLLMEKEVVDRPMLDALFGEPAAVPRPKAAQTA